MENILKYYGNNCNVIAEILLSRYDPFITRGNDNPSANFKI